jgi:predicted transposase/invertase (TIGR01784 family)
MPRFNKQEDELKTRFDKWLYFLKNLEDFEEIPAILNEGVFVKGFETAEIANFDKKQMTEYEDSLKVYRDLKGVVDTSFEEGEKIGIKKGIETGKNKMAEEMAKKSIKEGLSIDLISKLTGLSREEIEKLQ